MTVLVGEVYGSALNHPDAKWPADRMADHELALELLIGYRADSVQVTFPEPGSPREQVLRAALARDLRRHMRSLVGDFLAMAIDPEAPPLTPLRRRTRHVVFESPSPGKPSTWSRDLMMVGFLKSKLQNEKKIAAYKLTAEHFECSDRTVREVWAAYRKTLAAVKNRI